MDWPLQAITLFRTTFLALPWATRSVASCVAPVDLCGTISLSTAVTGRRRRSLTSDERFDRIDTKLADVMATLPVVADIQLRQAESLSQLTESLIHLTEAIDRHADAADAR